MDKPTIDRDNARALIARVKACPSDVTQWDEPGVAGDVIAELTEALEAALSAVPVEGEVTHDENTLTKVYGALDGFLDSDRIVEAVNEMQNAGILFRERAREVAP